MIIWYKNFIVVENRDRELELTISICDVPRQRDSVSSMDTDLDSIKEEQNSKNYSKRKKMQPLPGKLYKIPKMKNKSFFIRKKMNKKPHKKKTCLCTLFGGYMLL